MDDFTRAGALPAQELVAWALDRYKDRFSIMTSFQTEGMILVDMAVRVNPNVRIQTIDTGRMPEETYQLMDAVRERYRVAIEIIYPDHRELERMTALHGINPYHPALRATRNRGARWAAESVQAAGTVQARPRKESRITAPSSSTASPAIGRSITPSKWSEPAA